MRLAPTLSRPRSSPLRDDHPVAAKITNGTLRSRPPLSDRGSDATHSIHKCNTMSAFNDRNYLATVTTDDLPTSEARHPTSRHRLESGLKTLRPAENAGACVVSIKLFASSLCQCAAATTIGHAVSLLPAPLQALRSGPRRTGARRPPLSRIHPVGPPTTNEITAADRSRAGACRHAEFFRRAAARRPATALLSTEPLRLSSERAKFQPRIPSVSPLDYPAHGLGFLALAAL